MNIVTEDHGAWLDSRGRKHTEWSAITDDYDGAEDAHSPIGLGATEEEAVADLMDQLEEQGDCAVVSDGSEMFLRTLREKRDETEREIDAMPYFASHITAPHRLLLAALNAEIAHRAALPPSVLTETEMVDAMRRELRRVAALKNAFSAFYRAQLPES